MLLFRDMLLLSVDSSSTLPYIAAVRLVLCAAGTKHARVGFP